MTLIEKLNEIGFKKVKNNNKNKYIYTLDIDNYMDRFGYTIIYDPEINKFYIMAHKSSSRLIDEEEILRNHNNTNPKMKERWILLKEQLKDFDMNLGSKYD